MVEVHGSATLAGSGGLEASGESLGSHGQGDPPPGEWSESYFGGAGGGFSPEAIAAARAAFAEMELQQEEEEALLSMVDL